MIVNDLFVRTYYVQSKRKFSTAYGFFLQVLYLFLSHCKDTLDRYTLHIIYVTAVQKVAQFKV